MRKIIESTFVTLDGVIGEPQVWGAPYWNQEHQDYNARLLASADSLLLGRETYEVFAEVWPMRSGDEYSDKVNAMPKHVASRTLTDAASLHLWVFPVVAGTGQRLLDGLVSATHLRLVDTTVFGSGIVVHVLAPTSDAAA